MAITTTKKRGVVKKVIDWASGSKQADQMANQTLDQTKDLVINIRQNSPAGKAKEAARQYDFLKKFRTLNVVKWNKK